MAAHEKRAKRYPTDLTNAEWEIVRGFLPLPPKRGRKPTTDGPEVLNGFAVSGPLGRRLTGIQPVASKALNLMRARGRFSEDHEEEAPSQ